MTKTRKNTPTADEASISDAAATPEAIHETPTPDPDAPVAEVEPSTPAETATPLRPHRIPREGTKQATLIAMLRSDTGATIAEIMAATGWQGHTVRGAMAGALKKKLGLEVTSDKVEGRGRVYRLPKG